MPLIFTKDNDNNKLCAITTRLLTKKLKPKTSSNISSPGFVHENANILNEPQKTIDFQRNSEICPSLTGKMTAVSNEVVPENSEISSIISNSRKLQELKALHTLLKNIPTERNNKSPPPFPPRKPTLESIKEAIEKTKRLNENKNVETENNKSTIIAMSDASTSIEHRKTKLKKREASADSHVTGVRSSPTTRNNSETRRKKKKTFKKSQETDSVEYFLNNLDRISKPDYTPTNKDILHCRKATKGITEFVIPINSIPFLFVDVGGQRSQRQKWFRCFDSVTSILFLVSSSEFDQVLAEDRKTNRLEESRDIFDTIVNNVIFGGVSIILFLNKYDLLVRKVANAETDIRWYFPQFKGNSHSTSEVQAFILALFTGVKRDHKKPLYHHYTTAVDTENIKVVFNSVKDTILHRNLEILMLQ